MEETVQKSCWGLTAKAVIGFAGVILLVWLVGGGSETAAIGARRRRRALFVCLRRSTMSRRE
jgi:hypothetical protein